MSASTQLLVAYDHNRGRGVTMSREAFFRDHAGYAPAIAALMAMAEQRGIVSWPEPGGRRNYVTADLQLHGHGLTSFAGANAECVSRLSSSELVKREVAANLKSAGDEPAGEDAELRKFYVSVSTSDAVRGYGHLLVMARSKEHAEQVAEEWIKSCQDDHPNIPPGSVQHLDECLMQSVDAQLNEMSFRDLDVDDVEDDDEEHE